MLIYLDFLFLFVEKADNCYVTTLWNIFSVLQAWELDADKSWRSGLHGGLVSDWSFWSSQLPILVESSGFVYILYVVISTKHIPNMFCYSKYFQKIILNINLTNLSYISWYYLTEYMICE